MARILYLQYTNPAGYPPLLHSSRILADAGWDVLFFGITVPGVEALHVARHPRITVSQWPGPSPGWRQKLHYAGFVLQALALAVRWRPNWVYVSDPVTSPLGLLLSMLPGIQTLYHEHDSPSPGPRRGLIRFYLWTRRLLAQRARLCILPNEQRVQRFVADIGDAVTARCVWNCPLREDVAHLSRYARDGSGFVVLYLGSVVPSRLPLTVLDAMAMLPERVILRVIGYETAGSKNYLQELRATARALRLGFEYLGTLPMDEMLREGGRCDVGLALMPMHTSDVNMAHMVGASNKPFDYLACGLPVLVSDLPDWRSAYVEPGYGMACDPENPASIAAALRWFLDHPDRRRTMGARGRSRILAEWSYERQFAPALAILAGAAGREARSADQREASWG